MSLALINIVYFGFHYWQKNFDAKTQVESLQVTTLAKTDQAFPRIVLLKEAKAVSAAYEGSKRTTVETTPKAAKPVDDARRLAMVKNEFARKGALCPVLGPFKNPDQALKARDTVQKLNYDCALKEVVVDRYRENWVVLPSFPSRRAALSSLRELQSKGIDSYVITRGDWKNAISLGLFKKYESAIGVKDKMVSKGYPAELRQVDKVKTEYWLKINGADSLPNVKENLRSLLSSNSEILLQESLCK